MSRGDVGPARIQPATPFGEADLATCEHEQIHIPGSVQPHGALLVVAPGTHRILQASRTLMDRIAGEESSGSLAAEISDKLKRALGKL